MISRDADVPGTTREPGMVRTSVKSGYKSKAYVAWISRTPIARTRRLHAFSLFAGAHYIFPWMPHTCPPLWKSRTLLSQLASFIDLDGGARPVQEVLSLGPSNIASLDSNLLD